METRKNNCIIRYYHLLFVKIEEDAECVGSGRALKKDADECGYKRNTTAIDNHVFQTFIL